MFPPDQIWMIVVGFIIAFALAFGIGANDVANSFGTSVGAQVLTLRQACVLATIFETLGAVLLGSKVSDTIRKGITSTDPYVNYTINGTNVGTEMFMIGQVSALGGSCLWLIVATFLRVPVSGTHSIVGATIGFSLVAMGGVGVQWLTLAKIIGSWFISPVTSGCVSILLFYIIRKTILEKKDPLEPGLRFLPLAYGVTVVINLFSIFYNLPKVFDLKQFPTWAAYPTSFGLAIVVAVVVKLVIVPWRRVRIIREVAKDNAALKNDHRKKSVTDGSNNNTKEAHVSDDIKRPLLATSPSNGNGPVDDDAKKTADETNTEQLQETAPAGSQSRLNRLKVAFSASTWSNNRKSNGTLAPASTEEMSSDTDEDWCLRDRPEQAKVFSWMQILTAIFGSFAHGGNDVSNAIGPLVGLWLTAANQQVVGRAQTPVWILFYGGAGISIGLWTWGRRVIKTIGEELTKITPSSGLCIELGAAITVLVASNIGIPISTTHCKVGSVVAVGYFRSRDNVNWRVFRNILLAWGVTLPISGGLSAFIFWCLQYTIK